MRPVALLFIAALPLAAAEPITVPWGQTPSMLASRTAIVDLDSGARLHGTWLAVTPSTFAFDVAYSGGRHPVKPGVNTFDRAAIQRLRFQEKRIRARAWGTAAGYFTGAGIAARNSKSSRDAVTAFSVVIATTTTGYLIGRFFDKKSREVRLTE
jgi:hypothetical protein